MLSFRIRFSLFLVLLVSMTFSSVISAETVTGAEIITPEPIPKNIILLIGDGMGLSQISAGKIIKGHLNLEQFKHIGLLTNHSANELVTDSAAAATAMATGYKTNNHTLSLSPEGKPLKTIIEYAQDYNKATGLVVTSSITHATPAAFIAHVTHRNQQSLIAEQISRSGVDVLLGGGRGYFLPLSDFSSKRWDNNNLLDVLAKTHTIVHTEDEFNALSEVTSLVGLFSVVHMPRVAQRKPSLSKLTQKALEILSKNKNGFLLMVEASQIDWGGHENDQDYVLSELLDFDQAIGTALAFAKSNQQTLVIVTSDHETGGFAIHNGSVLNKTVTESKFTRNDHTATMVPVFAYGPGAEDFSGFSDNTHIGQQIIHYLSSYAAIDEANPSLNKEKH